MAIESDGDLRAALTSFAEVATDCLPVKYRTFHVRECVEILLRRDARVEPLELQTPSKKRCASSPSKDEPNDQVRKVYFNYSVNDSTICTFVLAA